MTLSPTIPIIEVKRALARARSSERRFEYELIDARLQRVVVLFRLSLDGRAIESYGVFWLRRAYNCYYAVPAGGGAPVFVRFDVVRNVEFALDLIPPEVRYTDLLLDLRVDSAGVYWEDTEEVTAASATGTITPSDVRTIEAARALLEGRYRRITSEVRALLRGLGMAV
ncbi:MAG: hypothetical protein EXR66_06160 [Dehalococcoidia bacterium]|nr:hypothetical protein [Dehalococcoidia bacterium]